MDKGRTEREERFYVPGVWRQRSVKTYEFVLDDLLSSTIIV